MATIIIEKGFDDGFQINVDTIDISKEIYSVYENHTKKLFYCVVSKKDGIIYAESEQFEKYQEYFPSVGFNIDNGKQKLLAIGISKTRNVDESIKKIGEQIKLQDGTL